MSLAPGSRVGTFEVSAAIGEGGMGRVYRARDTQLGRDVALKILPESFAHDAERLARFRREAQVLASLNHPHIGAIYGIEELRASSGAPASLALVLEYIDGPTLAEWITARTRRGGSGAPLAASTARLSSIHNLEDTLAIATQIVDALEAAHALGVVHRDLKPANIKVRPDGTVKVLDFGLAKFGDPLTSASGVTELANSPTVTSPAMTALGMILGTAAYMSPEQAKGRPVDKRADIWAFGCVLFEMLTGKRAFEGSDVSDTLANILKVEPDWPALSADTPASIRRLLRRCLTKDPAARLSDIGVARLEIADAAAGERIETGATSVPAAAAAKPRARWAELAAAAGLGALVGFVPMAATYFSRAPVDETAVRFAVPAGTTTFPANALSSGVAMSPDGRMVAYRALHPQRRAHVWVRAIDTLEVRELAGTEGAGQIFWSHDSRTIAFTADGKLKRIEATGGPVQTIGDIGAAGVIGGTWNPDGLIIVGHPTGPLSRVPAAGGTLDPLTTLDASAKETAHHFPQFLPDGRRFLFLAQPGGVLYVGSLDDDGRTRVGEFESNVRFSAGRLVFLRQNTLFAQPFDASSGTLDGEPVPLAENVSASTLPGARFGLFSASLRGDLVYEPATVEPGGTPVWVDRGGREMGPVLAGVENARFPRVSPDGRRLALTISDDVWVADLGGAPPIRLTADGARTPHFSPLWTPDGTRLVFESESPNDLRSLPSDGSGGAPVAMSHTGHIHPHGWTKDGQLLVAVDFLNGPDIITLSTDGKFDRKEVVANANVAEGNLGAELSPDRNWLAYAANSTGQMEIWVRPFPGPGAAVRVSPNGGVDPAWSRDGREIFYLEGAKMMVVAVKGGAPPQYGPPATLFERGYVGAAEQPPSFAVAPDGRFIMIKATATSATVPDSLTVVLNWPAQLATRTSR